ncbi:hypothetical protein HDU99_002597 [Rhizoclosmatium hyalinum]|nr:hypothetical protein HDU99_002597 [Rhizoclosmatium hyalinum]
MILTDPKLSHTTTTKVTTTSWSTKPNTIPKKEDTSFVSAFRAYLAERDSDLGVFVI